MRLSFLFQCSLKLLLSALFSVHASLSRLQSELNLTHLVDELALLRIQLKQHLALALLLSTLLDLLLLLLTLEL